MKQLKVFIDNLENKQNSIILNKEKKLNSEKKSNYNSMTKYIFKNFLEKFNQFKQFFFQISDFHLNDYISLIQDF